MLKEPRFFRRLFDEQKVLAFKPVPSSADRRVSRTQQKEKIFALLSVFGLACAAIRVPSFPAIQKLRLFNTHPKSVDLGKSAAHLS
jgi:hypothetical protein